MFIFCGTSLFLLKESHEYRCLRNRGCLEHILARGTLRQKSIPTKPRSRSVPDVVVLNSQIPLLAGLLIKYQRLPRGFFRNRFLPSLLVGCSRIKAILPIYSYKWKFIVCIMKLKFSFSSETFRLTITSNTEKKHIF